MNLLRKLLFPFAIIYWAITTLRNKFYDFGIFKSRKFQIPVIVVGNLSVGGTGKTPQIEFLIRLLQESYKVATLSRGYKRKSKGFVLADDNSDAEILGDEPFQYYRKFPKLAVAVDANRVNGIEQLLLKDSDLEVILLDDAFQHRKVQAGFYILLTTFDALYSDDFLLPMGNLRESSCGANRAQIVVVTKCPDNLSEKDKSKIAQKLNLNEKQQLFFSQIVYDDVVQNQEDTLFVDDVKKMPKVLIAGIAKPEPFFNYLKNEGDIILEFPDHHDFSMADLQKIKSVSEGKKIITTEKDYVRLLDKLNSGDLYYLGIKNSFFGDELLLRSKILNFIETKKREQ